MKRFCRYSKVPNQLIKLEYPMWATISCKGNYSVYVDLNDLEDLKENLDFPLEREQ